jgi:hypothetical protein
MKISVTVSDTILNGILFIFKIFSYGFLMQDGGGNGGTFLESYSVAARVSI